MRQIADSLWTVADARAAIGPEIDASWLRFAVRKLEYPELSVDGEAIRHPGYVPVPALALELANSVRRGELDLRRCRVCHEIFDVNVDEGIFGDMGALERFVCRGCAETTTAWTFWQEHVEG